MNLKQIFNKNTPTVLGRSVRVTYLPDHVGSPNAYIGYKGIIDEIWDDGAFAIKSETSSLVIPSKIKYKLIYL